MGIVILFLTGVLLLIVKSTAHIIQLHDFRLPSQITFHEIYALVVTLCIASQMIHGIAVAINRPVLISIS